MTLEKRKERRGMKNLLNALYLCISVSTIAGCTSKKTNDDKNTNTDTCIGDTCVVSDTDTDSIVGTDSEVDTDVDTDTDTDLIVGTDSEVDTDVDTDTNTSTDIDSGDSGDSGSDTEIVLSECYQGYFYIKNPEDIDGLISYNCINGNLEIAGDWNDRNTSLCNLDGLDNLRFISGELRITYTDNLRDISGLRNLTEVQGGIVLEANEALESLEGLRAITSTEKLVIWSENSLIDLSGLENLRKVTGRVNLSGNDSLTDLSGLSGLDEIGQYLGITLHERLESLEGLDNLAEVKGDIFIQGNTSLRSLNGLERLSNIGGSLDIGDLSWSGSISGNPLLESLDGLSNLKTVGSFIRVTYNESLPDCEICELADNVENGHRLTLGYGENHSDNCTETCPNSLENCYHGNYLIDEEEDIDGLSAFNCIVGDLDILGGRFQYLTGLENIYSIAGRLTIKDNFNLRNLKGLSGLFFVGNYIEIDNNQTIRFEEGDLPNLSDTVRDLLITRNISMENLSAFINIMHIKENLVIGGNPEITDLSGLDNIIYIGNNLFIGTMLKEGSVPLGNAKLVDISQLSNLEHIGTSLNIWHNGLLKDLTGLEKLVHIPDEIEILNNDSLESFKGLSNLKSVGSMFNIRSNDALIDLNGLESLEHIHLGLQIGGYSSYGIDEHGILPGNMSLQSLNGMGNLHYTGETFRIYGNNNLPQCKIDRLMGQIDALGLDVEIAPNGSEDPTLCEGDL